MISNWSKPPKKVKSPTQPFVKLIVNGGIISRQIDSDSSSHMLTRKPLRNDPCQIDIPKTIAKLKCCFSVEVCYCSFFLFQNFRQQYTNECSTVKSLLYTGQSEKNMLFVDLEFCPKSFIDHKTSFLFSSSKRTTHLFSHLNGNGAKNKDLFKIIDYIIQTCFLTVQAQLSPVFYIPALNGINFFSLTKFTFFAVVCLSPFDR